MRTIQPLNIWSDGNTKTATCLKLYLTYDDLTIQAALHYSLCDNNGTTIYEGQIFIAGQEYIDWGTSGDSNNEAYVIAASKLNLTIIP